MKGLSGCAVCTCTGCGMCIDDEYSDESCDCVHQSGCAACGCPGCEDCIDSRPDVCGCH